MNKWYLTMDEQNVDVLSGATDPDTEEGERNDDAESVDEYILQENETDSIAESYAESVEEYQRAGYEAVTLEPLQDETQELAQYGFIGMGAAGGLIMMSIGVAAIVRMFRSI